VRPEDLGEGEPRGVGGKIKSPTPKMPHQILQRKRKDGKKKKNVRKRRGGLKKKIGGKYNIMGN